MKEFRKKRHLKNIFFSWPVVLILAAFLFFLARSNISAFKSFQAVNLHLNETRDNNKEVVRKKTKLENKTEYLSGPYGLEKELRDRFDLKKPDEKLVIIIDNKKSSLNSGSITGGFFGEWTNLIKNKFLEIISF